MAKVGQGQTGFTDQGDFWELPFSGREITRCLVDHAFSLQLWSPTVTFDLRIECPFVVREANSPDSVMNPEEVSTLAPALSMFEKCVEHARAYKDGRLEVLFSDGATLHVEPDEQYEAWEVVGGGQRIVSTPGGELAVWSENPEDLRLARKSGATDGATCNDGCR